MAASQIQHFFIKLVSFFLAPSLLPFPQAFRLFLIVMNVLIDIFPNVILHVSSLHFAFNLARDETLVKWASIVAL